MMSDQMYWNIYREVMENYRKNKYYTRVFKDFLEDIKQEYSNNNYRVIYNCSNYQDLFKKNSKTWLLFDQLEKTLNTNVECFIHKFDNTMDIIIREEELKNTCIKK